MKYRVKVPFIPRDLNMLTMVGRKTGAFKDQRKGRGGARNEEHSYLEEYEESRLDEQEVERDEES